MCEKPCIILHLPVSPGCNLSSASSITPALEKIHTNQAISQMPVINRGLICFIQISVGVKTCTCRGKLTLGKQLYFKLDGGSTRVKKNFISLCCIGAISVMPVLWAMTICQVFSKPSTSICNANVSTLNISHCSYIHWYQQGEESCGPILPLQQLVPSSSSLLPCVFSNLVLNVFEHSVCCSGLVITC